MILADLLVTALYQVSAFDYMDFTVRTVFGGVGVLVLVALLLGPMSHVYKAVEKDREVPGGGEGLDRAPEASAPGGLEEYLEATVAAFAEKYRLSPREAQIVRLLSQGRDVPYIEQDLVLSKSTVKTHIRHIYEKTGVSSRQDLLDLLLNGSSPASE